jgi:hypothetical protein
MELKEVTPSIRYSACIGIRGAFQFVGYHKQSNCITNQQLVNFQHALHFSVVARTPSTRHSKLQSFASVDVIIGRRVVVVSSTTQADGSGPRGTARELIGNCGHSGRSPGHCRRNGNAHVATFE